MSKEEQEVLKTFKSGLGLTSAEREILVNYIDILQRENEELKEQRNKLLQKGFEILTENYIHKDIIKDIIANHYPDYAIMKIYELLGE